MNDLFHVLPRRLRLRRGLAAGPFLTRLALALGLVSAAFAGETRHLFNGRDLAGWAGLAPFWSVEDGAITGRTTPANVLTSNTFLVWQGGEPADFELRLRFRLRADNDRNQANSGVQYRSRVVDAALFGVGGYQADIDSLGKYVGMCYEERGRGIMMAPGERIRLTGTTTGASARLQPVVERLEVVSSAEAILAAYQLGGWNELRIVAEGNRLRHYLNGVLTADVTDADPGHARSSGILALQLHTGPPMTIQFKDITLRTLATGP